MVNKALQTPVNAFQKIGGSQELEAADYNTILDVIDAQIPGPASALANFTAGVGVAITSNTNQSGMQRLRITLTNAVVPLTDVLKYGSLKVLTWPNTNLAVRSARFNLTCVKDGTGTTDASTPSVGAGSAAASASTLATTMVDTVEQVALAGTHSAAAQKNGPHTAGTRFISAGATNYVYLNASNAGSSSSADGTLTISGTIDLFFEDFGLFS